MRRRATASALLLVFIGVVVGMTVFHGNIARATGLSPSRPVGTNATKVLEQNLDGHNIRVHEEGTAKVAPTPANSFQQSGFLVNTPLPGFTDVQLSPVAASLVIVTDRSGNCEATFSATGHGNSLDLVGPSAGGQALWTVQLPDAPILVDNVHIACNNNAAGTVELIGHTVG
jgi:hypothetical protein